MLLRNFYNDDKLRQLAKVLQSTHPDHQSDKLEHVIEDLMEMSDFRIHTLARSHRPAAEFVADEGAVCSGLPHSSTTLILFLFSMSQSSYTHRAESFRSSKYFCQSCLLLDTAFLSSRK
jgi:hypothetical protein